MATAKKTAARRAPAKKAVDDMAEQIENTAEASMSAFTDYTEEARGQFETMVSTFTENAEAARAQSEEAVAAWRESFEHASEQVRAVSADAGEAVREDMAQAVDFANELARAKSMTDAMDIQREYWNNVLETNFERSKRYSEAAIDASRASMEPVTKTFEAFQSMTPNFKAFFPFSGK